MKIGITKVSKEEKDEEPRRDYKVWFRTSDGKLRYLYCNERFSMRHVVEHVGRIESDVKMMLTNNDSMKENFLEEI